MKLICNLILTVFVFCSVSLSAQSQESDGWKYQLPKECWDAMMSGNHQLVAKYFAPSVELSLPSGSGLYSSKQASVVYQEFVSKSAISRAEIDNERQTGKSIMMIATFEISGSQYRVYVLTQHTDKGCQINKLRIEEEK